MLHLSALAAQLAGQQNGVESATCDGARALALIMRPLPLEPFWQELLGAGGAGAAGLAALGLDPWDMTVRLATTTLEVRQAGCIWATACRYERRRAGSPALLPRCT